MRHLYLAALFTCSAAVGSKSIRSSPPSSACERIHPEELPDECTCRDGDPAVAGPHSLVVECLKDFDGPFFNDTIGLKLLVEPCNPQGSSVSLDVTDRNHHIDYPISRIRAGELKIIPIPGLSVEVPEVGNVGIDVVVDIAGNPDLLRLGVGLDACFAVRHHFVCAESIPGLNATFPWWVLSGTYTFGDICNITSPTAAVVS